jgi:predicted RNase H-like HicB family nuclease
MKTFTVAVEKDGEKSLYVAQRLETPQAISQGRTEEEAIRNVKKAIEPASEHLGERVAEGKKDGRGSN